MDGNELTADILLPCVYAFCGPEGNSVSSGAVSLTTRRAKHETPLIQQNIQFNSI